MGRAHAECRRLISTHAPAGGATWFDSQKEARRYISTHAPAGGATKALLETVFGFIISTHAPAGGATVLTGKKIPAELFLLTPLREGRHAFTSS